MIIVSQNRTCIVNFNNISDIYIDNQMRIMCDDVNGAFLCRLGEYITEEECQDVFDMIIHDLDMHLTTNKNHIIYMPRSSEFNENN